MGSYDTSDIRVHHRASVQAANVLCLALNAQQVEALHRRLDNPYGLTCCADEASLLARLGSLPAVGLVLMDAACIGPTSLRIVETVSRVCPAAMVIILDEHGELDGETEVANLRILTGRQRPAELAAIVTDYLDTHRLRALDRALNLELSAAKTKLHDLSASLQRQNLWSTELVLRLHHVMAGLAVLDSFGEIAEFLVCTVAGMVRSRRVSLLWPDANREHLSICASAGIDAQTVSSTHIPVGAPIAGEVFAQSRTLMAIDRIPNHWDDRVDDLLNPKLPLICVALTGPDGPLAVLNVTDPQDPDLFNEESLTRVHAVAQAATIALVNQIRGQQCHQARDKVMLGLARLAESRDPETGKHLERVQHYCRMLAEEMAGTERYAPSITPEFIRMLVRSSPLHDIGKVGIPDEVLLKPGRLTPEEFEIMKRHPVIGGDTIKSLMDQHGQQDFLQMALEIAYHHHEKFDGSGYPDGLVGEDIPLPARILAPADVYDALTTARVYKAPMDHDRARSIILEGSGTHFEPDIVQAFLRREKDFAKLAVDLADK